jgi:hypothetical protein
MVRQNEGNRFKNLGRLLLGGLVDTRKGYDPGRPYLFVDLVLSDPVGDRLLPLLRGLSEVTAWVRQHHRVARSGPQQGRTGG